MKTITASALPEPSEVEIQKQAYHLWIEGGCLEGVELDNWLAAKELLRHHHGRSVSPRRKSLPTKNAKPAAFIPAA
jgi:hypothetical protein